MEAADLGYGHFAVTDLQCSGNAGGAVGTNFHFIFCSNETKITVRSQVLSNYLLNSVGVERVFALFSRKNIDFKDGFDIN